jgi:hypothetical protein
MDIYAVTSQEILERLSRHCPEALSTYFQCINRAGKDGQVFFSKSLVDVDMSENWRTFRNNIKKLARENLIEWHPFDKGIAVTLADVSDDE